MQLHLIDCALFSSWLLFKLTLQGVVFSFLPFPSLLCCTVTCALTAAAVFWVGLRRGWWLDLISFALKHINKGKSNSSKKKSKHKKKRKSTTASAPDGGPPENTTWVASTAAAAEAGGEGGGEGAAAAAKAFFTSMKAKMQGGSNSNINNVGELATASVQKHHQSFHTCTPTAVLASACVDSSMRCHAALSAHIPVLVKSVCKHKCDCDLHLLTRMWTTHGYAHHPDKLFATRLTVCALSLRDHQANQ